MHFWAATFPNVPPPILIDRSLIILFCFKDIDDCVFSRCANGATCVDGINQYSCICQDGFTGKLCQNGKKKILVQDFKVPQ